MAVLWRPGNENVSPVTNIVTQLQKNETLIIPGKKTIWFRVKLRSILQVELTSVYWLSNYYYESKTDIAESKTDIHFSISGHIFEFYNFGKIRNHADFY